MNIARFVYLLVLCSFAYGATILLQPLNWNIFIQSAFLAPGWGLCSSIKSTVLFLMGSDMTDIIQKDFKTWFISISFRQTEKHSKTPQL